MALQNLENDSKQLIAAPVAVLPDVKKVIGHLGIEILTPQAFSATMVNDLEFQVSRTLPLPLLLNHMQEK